MRLFRRAGYLAGVRKFSQRQLIAVSTTTDFSQPRQL